MNLPNRKLSANRELGVQRRCVSASGAIAIALGWCIAPMWPAQDSVAIAQIVRTEGISRRVYEQLPDLPRENQYISKETGKASPDETLVSRLVRYHIYVKGRPPFYRLDWKMTLADYLGVFGELDEAEYPGANKLKRNPMAADIAVIRQLNQNQRNALVQALVDAFSGQQRSPQAVPKPTIQLPPER